MKKRQGTARGLHGRHDLEGRGGRGTDAVFCPYSRHQPLGRNDYRGTCLGLSRKAATEFSFFLAIPTIFGATVYDLYKSREVLSVDVLPSVAIGFVVSFFSAILVVRWLLRFVSTNDFRVFGWYRIVFGIVVLALCVAGLADF